MERLSDIIWGPWLVYLLLGFAGLLTVGTGVVQARGWLAGASREPRAHARLPLMLAAGAGMGAVGGTALALTTGGPGAVFWLWLATLLGMAIHFAEAALTAQSLRTTRVDADHPGLAGVMRRALPRIGPALGAWSGLMLVLTAVIAGGGFQIHQGAALLHQAFSLLPWAGGLLITAIALPFLFSAPLRSALFRLAPWLVLAYVLACLIILTRDTWGVAWAMQQIWAHAFDLRPVAGGLLGTTFTVAVREGVRRAVFVGELGLGTASLAVQRSGSAMTAGRRAMLAPLVTAGVVSTLTALVVLIGPAERSPVVEDRLLLPLERPQSRGLRPNREVGQVIVVPEDAGFQPDRRYAMVLRANPRGHALWQAKLLEQDNAIVVPRYQVADDVDTVVFRPKDEQLQQSPAWDVRVAVDARVILNRDNEFIELRPSDPDLVLTDLIEQRDLQSKPYVVLGDYHFTGTVARAVTPSLGEHLAMFERRPKDAPLNPALHEFYRLGYRGPYIDRGQDRPPWAVVADADFEAPPDAVLHLRMVSPPRGADILHLSEAGHLEAPPWDFLGASDTVVLRHLEDPDKDLFVSVLPVLEQDRWRFLPRDPRFETFENADRLVGYSHPHLLTVPYDFEVVVREGTRFPAEQRERKALVPLHPRPEPWGPEQALPYTPHPGEVLLTDMEGPVFARDGVQVVTARFRRSLGPFGTFVMVTLGLLLVLTTVAAWSTFGARTTTALWGAEARPLFYLLFVGVSASTAWIDVHRMLGAADGVVGLLLIPNLIALFLLLPRITNAARNRG